MVGLLVSVTMKRMVNHVLELIPFKFKPMKTWIILENLLVTTQMVTYLSSILCNINVRLSYNNVHQYTYT